MRRYAGAGRIEREFAERYPHSSGAEIAQAENALAIGNHDEADVFFRPVAENPPEPAASADRQIHASRLTEDMGRISGRLRHGGRIDQRHVGRRVRHQDRIEQRLVAGLQI